jgi:hypothetical protein
MAEVIAIFKDKELQEFISSIAKRNKDATDRQKDFVKLISASVYTDIDRHFKEEKGPDGKWDDFSDSYKKQVSGELHFRTYGGNRIAFAGPDPKGLPKGGDLGEMLQDTGTLRQRIEPFRVGRNWRKISKGILWFNRAKTEGGFPYAAHHDSGASSWKGNPRPFMWLSNAAVEKISKETLSFILEEK